MFFVYSVLYTLSLVVLLPYFLLNREKYLSGLTQRLGFLPDFSSAGKPVVWVHCVSVGETNAARPLIRTIKKLYPGFLVVVSTTTRTGYDLASKVFANEASFVFYMPFDIPYVVNKVMKKIKPNLVLILETEIWFNFFRTASRTGANVILLNGRLSQKSADRYAMIPKTMKRVLHHVEAAFMQTKEDALRLLNLGIGQTKVKVIGNFKFDQELDDGDLPLTAYFRERFGLGTSAPLIIAASTHAPEERWILEAFGQILHSDISVPPRLILAPRHPERFDEVAELIAKAGLTHVRRSDVLGLEDDMAEVVLLDSIGELRSVYPLADLVFVGGSLIPHGGQSILEPALACKAIITGNSMTNFEAAAKEFTTRNAFIRLPELSAEAVADELAAQFMEVLQNAELRDTLAQNAYSAVINSRGATDRALKYLKPYLQVAGNVLRG